MTLKRPAANPHKLTLIALSDKKGGTMVLEGLKNGFSKK